MLQSGGPTAVLNTTLAAVIDQARAASSPVQRVLGAQSGFDGLCRGEFLDLTNLGGDYLHQLKHTAGASLGTSRFAPSSDDLARATKYLVADDVRWVIVIGGNGSLRGAAALSRAAKDGGSDLCVVAAPKTIDNDIAGTDRCPGYASAARYVAQAVADLGADVRALPQPVSIFETMGRNVGWLGAASVLAKRDEADAPHLIYLPEKPFDVGTFIGDIDRVLSKHGWCVAVVSEGLRNAGGEPIYEIDHATQRDDCNRPLVGGVAGMLADAITHGLKIRCRSEKPGLCGRASMVHVAVQDVKDAELVGRAAVRAAMEGRDGHMISLLPVNASQNGNGNGHAREGYEAVAIAGAGGERPLPIEWLDGSPLSVGRKFIDYARPLVGPLMNHAQPLSDIAPAAGKIRVSVAAKASAPVARDEVQRA